MGIISRYEKQKQSGIKNPKIFIVAYGPQTLDLHKAADVLNKSSDGREMLAHTYVTTLGAHRLVNNRMGFGSIRNIVFLNDPTPKSEFGDKMFAFFKVEEVNERKYALWSLGTSQAVNPNSWDNNFERFAIHQVLVEAHPIFREMTPENTMNLTPFKD